MIRFLIKYGVYRNSFSSGFMTKNRTGTALLSSLTVSPKIHERAAFFPV